MAEQENHRQAERQVAPDRIPARSTRENRGARDYGPADQEPDVLLDVPVLKVDEINLEVDDLQARISLQAQVLDLLKLHVGADVSLGRVSLGIKGVDAAALLKVRLDNVAAILERVMNTLDENPQMVGELSRGLREAVGEVGRGSGQALQDVGEESGGAVEQLGQGAGGAVRHVGQQATEAVEKVGEATDQLGGEAAGGPARLAEDTRDVAGNARQPGGKPGTGATAGRGRTRERSAPPRRGVPSRRAERRG